MWRSVDTLFEEPDDSLAVWNRADLDSHLHSEKHSKSQPSVERNAEICERFARGDGVETLARAFDLMPKTIRRIIGI